MEYIVYEWPGGLKSRARPDHLKLSRPWQTEMRVNQAACPFCNDVDREVLTSWEDWSGWRVRKNKFPAAPIHDLILPPSCWGLEELYRLGGVQGIYTALSIARTEMQKYPGTPIYLPVHQGWFGGQNLPHLHYHIAQYDVYGATSPTLKDEWIECFEQKKDLVIFNDSSLLVGVGGIRAGQCFILALKEVVHLSHLSMVLSWLIDLFNGKFKSKEGLPPNFSLVLYCIDNFLYGLYTPVLNHWGGCENLALYQEVPVLLPWPHELTVAHLKS